MLNPSFYGSYGFRWYFCNHNLEIIIAFACIIFEDCGTVAGGWMKTWCVYDDFTSVKQVKRQRFFLFYLFFPFFLIYVLQIEVIL